MTTGRTPTVHARVSPVWPGIVLAMTVILLGSLGTLMPEAAYAQSAPPIPKPPAEEIVHPPSPNAPPGPEDRPIEAPPKPLPKRKSAPPSKPSREAGAGESGGSGGTEGMGGGPGAPSLNEGKPRLIIQDFLVNGVEASTVQGVYNLLVQAATDLGGFEVLTYAQVRALLDNAGIRQATCDGSDPDACEMMLTGLSERLDAPYLVTGGFDRLAGRFGLSLALIDTQSGEALNRVRREAADEVALAREAQDAIRFLLGPVLERRMGMLSLKVSEEGATVLLDGRVLGSTPLSPQKVPAGFHELLVRRDSFVEWKRTVRIEADATLELEVRLTPSREYWESYRLRNERLRWGAYSAWGVGGAMLLSATGLTIWNQLRYDDYAKDRALYLTRYNDPAQCGGANTAACVAERSRLADQRDEILAVDYVNYALWGVGGAAAIAGFVLYFTTPDPYRYDSLFMGQGRVEGPRAGLRYGHDWLISGAFTDRGAGLALSGRF